MRGCTAGLGAALLVAAVLASPAPAAVGPVAAYSMDQGAGTALPDISGNGNAGTLAGQTWITGGRFGGALNFSGNIVTVPDSASLDLTTGMTQEAWVRPSALGGIWRTVLLKERPGGLVYSLYAHGTDSTNVPMSELTINGAQTVAGAATLPLGVWSHIATTYDGATMRFYVNGTQVGQKAQTGSIVTSTGALRIGGNTIWGEHFAGDIDEVRIYDRALTAVEVQGDMNQPVGVVDGEPPTAPSNLNVTGSLANAQLTWTAATDNVAVVRYNVHRSTTPGFTPSAANRVGQPTGTSFTDTPPAGTYFYKVTAEDGAGNVGPASNEVERAGRRPHRPLGTGDAERGRRDRPGHADLGRRHRQRGCRPLQRPPLDHRRLHAERGATGSPSRPAPASPTRSRPARTSTR